MAWTKGRVLSWGLLLLWVSMLPLGAAPASFSWSHWARSDYQLAQILERQRACLLASGQTLKNFSQGRLPTDKAQAQLAKLQREGQSAFSQLVRLEGQDQTLRAGAIDLGRRQLAQIKAAAKVAAAPIGRRGELLKLQTGEEATYAAQSRYLRLRAKGINLLLEGAQEAAKRSSERRGPAAPPAKLVEYYRFQRDLIQYQLQELSFSQAILAALEEIAQERKGKPLTILPSVRQLGRDWERLSPSADLSALHKAYAQEWSSLARFAEAVILLQKDRSPDAVSRLQRWNSKLQRDSQAAAKLDLQVWGQLLP